MTDGAGLNQALSRRFGVQGAPSPNVASEVFPTVPMEGPSAAPEFAYLRQSRLCEGWGEDAAGAGARSAVQLINPSGSGVLGIVDRLFIVNDQASAVKGYIWGLKRSTTTDAAAAAYPRDTRIPTATTLLVGARTAAHAGDDDMKVYVPASETRIFHGPWILHPGNHLYVQGAEDNLGVWAGFWWEERAATEGELLGVAS